MVWEAHCLRLKACAARLATRLPKEVKQAHTALSTPFQERRNSGVAVRCKQVPLGLQGAAGVMDEGGSGIDGMAGRPRKSWQMRKRQERAAIKEGLAEWQARTGALIVCCDSAGLH